MHYEYELMDWYEGWSGCGGWTYGYQCRGWSCDMSVGGGMKLTWSTHIESVAEKMVPRAATQSPVRPRLRTSKQMLSLRND